MNWHLWLIDTSDSPFSLIFNVLAGNCLFVCYLIIPCIVCLSDMCLAGALINLYYFLLKICLVKQLGIVTATTVLL